MNRMRASFFVAVMALLTIGSIHVLGSRGPIGDASEPDAIPDCVSTYITSDGPGLSVEGITRASGVVTVVVVDRVDKARWSTTDGSRPYRQALIDGARIVQPLHMSISAQLSGPKVDTTMDAFAIGGQVGCDQTILDSQVSVGLGQYVAVALQASPSAVPSGMGDFLVIRLWPVEDGEVDTDILGKVRLENLTAAFEKASSN
jgi:hypothetical protein